MLTGLLAVQGCELSREKVKADLYKGYPNSLTFNGKLINGGAPIIAREFTEGGKKSLEWMPVDDPEFKRYWCVWDRDLEDMLAGHKRYRP